MNQKYLIGNAILWAAAIIAAAILKAPQTLVVLVLPTLGFCALVLLRPRSDAQACAQSSR